MEKTIELGDTVAWWWKGYSVGTVCQVYKDGTIDVFRPYVHTADFSCVGEEDGAKRVICYIGTETVRRLNPKNVNLLVKGGPLR